MKVAITGGTGFVGRHLARHLSELGHTVILISRGEDKRDTSITRLDNVAFKPIGTNDAEKLREAFTGVEAVAHCAGINREIGTQTYQSVHVEGTQRVVDAAQAAGVRKVLLVSFLRARPDCGSPYHESKFQAEEIVRNSSLDYTVFKPGVIYGTGDHMLDHLSHAFHSLPLFGLVGFRDQYMQPLAIEDLVKVMTAALGDERLSRKTVSVLGPERLTLEQAVKRVAGVVGKKPIFFKLPVSLHYVLAFAVENVMTIPLVSKAQVRILSEGLTEPLPAAESLPPDLMPRTPFSEEQIRAGLPAAGGFSMHDCRFFTSRI